MWPQTLEKIYAILHMEHPCTLANLCRFIGCVDFYPDMWPSHDHILNPITDCLEMKMGQLLNWTDVMQHAFVKVKLFMAADALTTYPDCNKRFDICIDSSDFQMGACIVQDGRPVAYYSNC